MREADPGSPQREEQSLPGISICICIWICKRAKGLGWVDHQGQRPHPDQRVIDMQSLLLPQHCGISASFLFAHCNGATTTTATSTATANATTVATTDDDNNGISSSGLIGCLRSLVLKLRSRLGGGGGATARTTLDWP
uniref:HDC10482 n=1 Tax=Drosophila melanogaster TaxID=7227 RepID=Q6IL38_DROME|nr:TPA_inf: HDC10482 [Drosophila melanogaster]